MRLKHVKLKGLIGIKRGLGLDEVDVDLSSLRGVVGIVGANGTGKTTFMECLQPFRVMPSRKIGDTDRPLLFKDAVCLRQSYKDLTFEMYGKNVRVQVTADCDSDKQDGYIWIDGEPFSTGKVTELDEQLLKLMGTPEATFASVFAAQSAKSLMMEKKAARKEFFAEFLGLAQYQEWSDKAKAVAGYVAGIIDQGRATILQLESATTGLEAQREAVRILTTEAEHADSLLVQANEAVETKRGELSAAENLYRQQEAIHAAVQRLEQVLTELTRDFESAQASRRAEIDKDQAFLSASHAWSNERNRELFSLEWRDNVRIEPHVPKDFAADVVALSELRVKLERQKEILRDIQALEQQIRQASESLSAGRTQRKDAITRARARSNEAARQSETLRGNIERARKDHAAMIEQLPFGGAFTDEALGAMISEYEQADIVQRDITAKISAAKTKFAVSEGGLREGLRQSQALAQLATKIPPGADRSICEDCGFAKASIVAGWSATDTEEKLKALDEERRQELAALELQLIPEVSRLMVAAQQARDERRLTALAEAKLEAITNMEQSLTLQAEQAEQVLREIAAIELDGTTAEGNFTEYERGVRQGIADVSAGLIGGLAELVEERTKALDAAIKSHREAAEADVQRLHKIEVLKSQIADREAQVLERNRRVEQYSEACNDAYTRFTNRKAELREEIQREATKLDPALEEKISLLRGEVRSAESQVSAQESAKREAATRLRVAQTTLAGTEQSAVSLVAARTANMSADAERAEWALLQNICGRDKLQALELDAAAPAITGIANQLLAQCFGGRFSINFETLDEKGREVFDLMVTDAHSGKGEDVRLKSGGQKVINLHALRLAKTMYMKERSGRDFRSLFLDECDGALSSDVRREFAEMNRMAMRMGGFETMFIVSHSPEVIDTVDRVIEFGSAGIVVR